MVLNRREFLKSIGVGAFALNNPRELEKLVKYLAYTQQSNQSLYTVQGYNFNNERFAEEPKIANRLTTQGIASDEFLQQFDGVNLGNGDYLIGSVLNGEGSFYKNETNSLEGRVNIHDYIKNLIKAEPVRTRALGVKGENGGDYNIFFDDNKKIIHAVDLATNEYFGDKTGTFYNIFEFVPIDMLSARVNNHSSPFHDNVLALKIDDGYWNIYWWEDISASIDNKKVAKPIPTLEKFDLEGMFYNEDKRLGNVISLGIANLYGEQYDSLYAIRTPPLQGRIDDSQAARDIIDFNQDTITLSSYRKRGIITRFGQSVPVYDVDPSITKEDSDDAMKYWCLVTGISHVLIDKDEPSRILVEVGTPPTGMAGGGIVGTYRNNRARLGKIVISQGVTHDSDFYRKSIYRHEFGHALGFYEHLEGGG